MAIIRPSYASRNCLKPERADLCERGLSRRPSPTLAGAQDGAHPRSVSDNRRSIFRLGVVDLGVERVTLPNGHSLDLPIIRHPGASAVVALDEHQRVSLISQYRHAVGGDIWEIPAGCRELQESIRQCAERELLEEAGLVAGRWDHLGSIVTIPSFCDERIDPFLARELSRGQTRHEPDEVIRVEQIELSEALAMVRRGQIIDAKTITGLFQASAFLKDG